MENRCDPKSKYYDEEANYFYDYYYVNDRNHSHCVDGPYFKTKSGQVGYAICGIHFTKEEWEKHPEVIKASYKESYNRCDPKSKFYDKCYQSHYQFYYVDNQNRPHCVNGPFFKSIVGQIGYAINGIEYTPEQWEKHPEAIKKYGESCNRCDPKSIFYNQWHAENYEFYYVDKHNCLPHSVDGPCSKTKFGSVNYAVYNRFLLKEEWEKHPEVIKAYKETYNKCDTLLNRCDPNCKFYSEWYKEHYTFFYVNDKNERHSNFIGGTQFPASRSKDGTLWYSINGKNHRLDGPAVIYPDGHKRYYIDGIEYLEVDYYKNVLVTAPKNSMDDKISTEKETSIESYDKCDPKSKFYEEKIALNFKYYYVNGSDGRHKDEGQIQSETKDNDIYYVVNDKFHRLDGPALYNISINRNYKTYFINGKDYSEKEYWEHPDVKNYPDNKISKRINGWLLDNKTYWKNPKKWQTQYVETYDKCDIHSYYYNANIASEYKYYYVNDLCIAHKDNGPQCETKDGYIRYVVNGICHSLNSAARIYKNRLDYYLYGEEVTYKEFQKHPDVIANSYESYNKCDPYSQFYDVMIAQSYEFYYINKEQISSRNTKLPSFRRKIAGIKSDSILIGYTIDGKFHRLDGPAITYANGKVDYYLNGNFISPKDYWTSSEVMDYVNKTYYHSIKWNEVRFMSDEDISKLFLKIGYYHGKSPYRITDANPSSKIDLSKDISVVDKKPTKEDIKRALDAISNIRASGEKIVTNAVTNELKSHIDFLTNQLIEPKNSALEELQNIAQSVITDKFNKKKESVSSPTIGLDLGVNEPSLSLVSEVSIVGDPSNSTTIVKMKPEATSSDIGKIRELLDKSDPDYAHNACDDGPSWLSKTYDYCYLDAKDRFHNNNGPAFKKKDKDQFGYYQHGQLHRLDGPALIVADKQPQYYIRGVNYSEIQYYNHPEVIKNKPISNEIVSLNDRCNPDSKFYNKDYADVYLHYFVNDDNIIHCDNGPAVITVSRQQFYKNGLRHRLDGAAVIRADGGPHEFWINGKIYTSISYWNHPEVIAFYKDKIQTSTVKLTEDNSYKESYDRCDPKSKFYVKHYADHYTKALVNDEGDFHCDNGPAVCSNQEQDYYKNGKLHRLDGPAFIKSDGTKYYYIYGVNYSEEGWKKHPDVIETLRNLTISKNKFEGNKTPDSVASHFKSFFKKENFEISASDDVKKLELLDLKDNLNIGIAKLLSDMKNSDITYDMCDPKCIKYSEDLAKRYKRYVCNERGFFHCLDGPAVIDLDGSEHYYIEGSEIIKDLFLKLAEKLKEVNNKSDVNSIPYVESYNKCDPESKFYHDITASKFKYFYVNENYFPHRGGNLPQCEPIKEGYTDYIVDGKYHRLDGPAMNHSSGYKTFYINGIEYTEKEYWEHPDVKAYMANNTNKDYVESYNKCDPKSKFYEIDTARLYKYYYVNEENISHRGKNLPQSEAINKGYINYIVDGKYHRLDGPAIIHNDNRSSLSHYYINGMGCTEKEYEEHPDVKLYKKAKAFFVKDSHDRCNPAFKHYDEFYENNFLHFYANEKGWAHCLDGPALIYKDGKVEYFIDGQEYSEQDYKLKIAQKTSEVSDIPYKETFDRCDPKSLYYQRGYDNLIHYYVNNKLKAHNENGPAIVYKDGSYEYWVNGLKHRYDGPASSFKNGTVQEYFLLGIKFKDKESFQKKAKELLKLENKLFPLEKQTIIKESDKKMEKKSFLEMSKEDAIDGAYRAGARQAVAIVKKNTLKLIEGNTSSAGMEALSNLLSTEFGTAVLSMGAGLALTYAPGISENDKAARLAKEFRVEGYSISMEQLVTLVMSAMGPSLQEVMEKLPSVSMEVTPAKNKKKLRVKPPELPKEEEIEVDDEEYETDDDFNQLNNA